MFPRADLSKCPRWNRAAASPWPGHVGPALLVRRRADCRITFGSITLSPATTSTSPSKRIRSSSSAPLRAASPVPTRLILERVGRPGKAPVHRGHDAFRHAAHHHHVEHRAAQVVSLQRADRSPAPPAPRSTPCACRSSHARPLAARQNHRDKWPFHKSAMTPTPAASLRYAAQRAKPVPVSVSILQAF